MFPAGRPVHRPRKGRTAGCTCGAETLAGDLLPSPPDDLLPSPPEGHSGRGSPLARSRDVCSGRAVLLAVLEAGELPNGRPTRLGYLHFDDHSTTQAARVEVVKVARELAREDGDVVGIGSGDHVHHVP